MIRLKDIAARAGVSVMTVSKVLRDAPDISAATKARIRKLAEEMGYVPHSHARALRYRSTRLFGLLIATTTNPIFARMVMAIEERCQALDYELILGHTLNDPAREEALIRRCLARRVDGLFITPVYRMNPSAAIYGELTRHKIPTIILGHHAPFCASFPNVETDDLNASVSATRYLLELGHRRIAYLAGAQVSPAAQQRLEGHRRALKEARIDWDDRLIFTAGNTVEEGRTAALQMLNEGCDATAVRAHNDLVAIGAGGIFLDQGIRIPEQLSLVGFGNVLTAEHFRVPLTTVRQPKFRLGVAAMESMVQLLRGETPPPKRLPAEIVPRKSTAPPRDPQSSSSSSS
jgi:DNA-binding LacI/PurR family transcriptional regulator